MYVAQIAAAHGLPFLPFAASGRIGAGCGLDAARLAGARGLCMLQGARRRKSDAARGVRAVANNIILLVVLIIVK